MVAKLAEDQDFIVEGKAEKLTVISSLLSLVQERLKVLPKKLPVKQFIIGKSISHEEIDRMENEDFNLTLRVFKTYILENLPLGTENKSMGK